VEKIRARKDLRLTTVFPYTSMIQAHVLLAVMV
jgi:hypothetical protein